MIASCNDCKHEDKVSYEWPCSDCDPRWKDKFEPKEEFSDFDEFYNLGGDDGIP